MSGSVVFYRFKAQKEPSTVKFEGTGISVWDLKKEILAENKLGKGADFDFAVYNADTNEEYSDDKAIVPRSTSVIARRLPPSRPGRGNAQNYMASSGSSTAALGPSGGQGAGPGRRGNMTQRFDVRNDPPPKQATPTPQPTIVAGSDGGDEASKIAAMFANTDEQWKTTQDKMSTATYYGFRRPNPSGSRPTPNSIAPDKPVPPGYVCYRCGQAGHWIQDCPTNSDPEHRNKPRIKRTTGIPKSFLQTVEAPSQDGDNQQGLMVTAEGNFVIARPDAASWEKHRAVTANLTSSDIQNAVPTDPDLTCPLCNRLLRDAVKTPCCSTSYCEECIHNYLSENDFVCPECESKVKSLKNLVKDEDRRVRAQKYLEDTLQASKAAGEAEKAEDGSLKDEKEQKQVLETESERRSPEEASEVKKTPIIRTEDLGPAEEGELDGDEASISKTRSQSPRSTRASSIAQSDNGRQPGPNTNSQSANLTNGNTMANMGNQNMVNGGNGMANNMMSQGQMNNMFTQFNNNQGNRMPPQMQMLQGQMQGTMQMLQNPAIPPAMKMQLSMQLQQLQYTFGQMVNMMNNGYGNPMQMQMAMYQQAQQLANMQQYTMMQSGMYGNGNNNTMQYGQNGGAQFQRTGQMNMSRHLSQYEEDSADSPYMRVPTNPKFRAGKRDRPEDFVSVNYQANKR